MTRWYVIANIPYFAERGYVGSYTEYSPSLKGVRIFALGHLPYDWADHERGIEVYSGNGARFLTVTGLRIPGTPPSMRRLRQALYYL